MPFDVTANPNKWTEAEAGSVALAFSHVVPIAVFFLVGLGISCFVFVVSDVAKMKPIDLVVRLVKAIMKLVLK